MSEEKKTPDPEQEKRKIKTVKRMKEIMTAYYMDRTTNRLLRIDKNGAEWVAWLHHLTDINPVNTAFAALHAEAQTYAQLEGERVAVVKVAHWSEADFDELHSRVGTGGPLTCEGALAAVIDMNRKRDLHEKLSLLLETHQADLVRGFLEMVYQQVVVAEPLRSPGR